MVSKGWSGAKRSEGQLEQSDSNASLNHITNNFLLVASLLALRHPGTLNVA